MQLFQYMFSVIQGTEQQEYFTNKLKEFKKLIDEDNLTIYRIRDIPFNNDNPINIVCDQEDIKIGEYSISACNI
ncbi:MAG: hypothetical protein LBH96_06695 [Candidatus Peribacteria bacterium]|nr:hypothetical protein [Candidatus Peribacteria bacterium]